MARRLPACADVADVHRGSAVDQHPLARLEAVAAEQAPHSPERTLRDLAALADDGPVGRTRTRTTDARAVCRACQLRVPCGGRAVGLRRRASTRDPVRREA